MKRLVATVICLVALSAAAIPVDAQTRSRRRSVERTRYARTYDARNDSIYQTNNFPLDDDSSINNDSIWDNHRDKITTAGGAVGGAILGALIGGKKGALIGAITGGAGAAVYTYKVRDKGRTY